MLLRVISLDGHELLWGRNVFDPADIAHVLVPGYGRVGGVALTAAGRARAATAAALLPGLPADGVLVCAGYKSPADHQGPIDGARVGVAEADLLAAELERLGIPTARLCIERESVDTVTNLLRAEAGMFPDGRAVAIVAQRAHLDRIVHVIAPRTLRRPFVGVVAPGGHTSSEGGVQQVISRLLLAGLPSDPSTAAEIATRRVQRAWRAVETLRGRRDYHGDA